MDELTRCDRHHRVHYGPTCGECDAGAPARAFCRMHGSYTPRDGDAACPDCPRPTASSAMYAPIAIDGRLFTDQAAQDFVQRNLRALARRGLHVAADGNHHAPRPPPLKGPFTLIPWSPREDRRPLGERLRARRLERGFARPIDLAAAIEPDPAKDDLRVRFARRIDECERGAVAGPFPAWLLDVACKHLGVEGTERDAWFLAAGTVPLDVHQALAANPALCDLVRKAAAR